MKRRHLITNAAIGGAIAATIGSCGPASGPKVTADNLPNITWNMATSWPKSLETLFGTAELISQRVSEMTNGRFQMNLYAAGELVGGLEVMDAVQTGAAQCGHTASYYYIGKSPALAFGTTVPFGLNGQQQNAWLYQGGGLDLIQKIYAGFGIINFPAGNSGTQMGGWYNKEVNSVADLQGLKMRIPGLGGKVMAKLGVNVQNIPGGEVYLALDRGAIDAAEWVGPFDDQKLGLHKAAQYYYYPGWWEPGPSFDLLINLAAWNQLPTEYQEVLKSATAEANLHALAQYDVLNARSLSQLISSGVTLQPYSEEIMAAAKKATEELMNEEASKDATFKGVYEQWKGFRQEIYQWHQINELSFAEFSFGS
jgi:TRAP-type mannitol/chloroaromatic compound transport system substrate-binding protein